MFWLSLIFLVGINIAPLIFNKFNIWEAQGLWTQIMTLAMFSWSFIEKPKNEIVNWPLAVFFFWAGINTIAYCYLRNNILNFLPFLNVLTAVVLFNCFSRYLTTENFEYIIKVLKWIILVTAFLCVIQYFGYSQFFKMLYPGNKYFNNPVVGFIGQPTHLAGFLGMMFPVFLYKPNREKYLTLGLLSIILLFITGTTKNDPAISGIVVAFISSLYFLDRTNLKRIIITCSLIGLLGFFIYGSITGSKMPTILNFHGRIDIWKYYLEQSQVYSLTGVGLGVIKDTFKLTPYPTAMHAHLEPLQILFELGAFGLLTFLIMIDKFVRIKVSGTGLVFKSVVVGFLFSCLFNYPAHIWLSATYAVLAYSAVYALREDP